MSTTDRATAPPPRLRLAGRSRPTYGVCVCGGGTLGIAAAVALSAGAGGEPGPRFVLAAATAAVAASIALAFSWRAVTGEERFTFYHYQLTILAAAGAVALAAGGPVLPILDLLAVALAVTQAVGRIGCLAAGCCHGRPARRGVRYGPDHAADGFPDALVGVPLVPVQAIESLALAALAAGAAALVVAGAPAGAALALYLAGYAAARFLCERLRGDRRPHRGGLSEGRWTALASASGAAALSVARVLPLGTAATMALVSLAAGLAVLALADRRRDRRDRGLLDGRHACEIAAVLRRVQVDPAAAMGNEIRVARTGSGLRLSTDLLDPRGGRRLVTFSTAAEPLDASTAVRLARLLAELLPAAGPGELVAGVGGVWHLLTSTEDTA